MRYLKNLNRDKNENRKNILIITGGFVDEIFLKSLVLIENYSLIIAADKGLKAADNLELPVDFILGDFDSLPIDVLKKYQNKSIPTKIYPSEKDMTDTQIALELALEYNPTNIDIVGATGSRMDHSLANLHLLLISLHHKVSTRILDEKNKIYLKDGSFTIKKDDQYGNYVSLIPFTDQVKGLKLKGFKYPLDGITLSKGSSLGVSNEIIEDEGKVEFDEGILIVFETKD